MKDITQLRVARIWFCKCTNYSKEENWKKTGKKTVDFLLRNSVIAFRDLHRQPEKNWIKEKLLGGSEVQNENPS